MQRSALTELVKRAEKHIGTQEYYLARALLEEALKLDPRNLYVPAILERVDILQSMARDVAELDTAGRGSPLSVSVGKEFKEGLRPAALSQEEMKARFRRLLTVASTLYDRGSYESAYESLMKAEDLYPRDPELSALKEKIVPAYESMIGKSNSSQVQRRRNDLPGAAASMAAMILSDSAPGSDSSPTTEPGFSTFNDRLTAFRRRQEEARQQQNQSPARKVTSRSADQSETPPSEREKNGFISTLLKRKLFE
jgi:tetratricopeptide (TPR) repeat protein